MWTWTYCRNLPAFNHSDWDALFQLSEEKLFCFMETNFKTRTKLYFPDWWRARTCLMAEYNPQSSGSGFSCLLLWKEAQVLKCHFAKKKKKKKGAWVMLQYGRVRLSSNCTIQANRTAAQWDIRNNVRLFGHQLGDKADASTLFIYLFIFLRSVLYVVQTAGPSLYNDIWQSPLETNGGCHAFIPGSNATFVPLTLDEKFFH